MNSSTESAAPELQTGTYLRFLRGTAVGIPPQNSRPNRLVASLHRNNFGIQTGWLGTPEHAHQANLDRTKRLDNDAQQKVKVLAPASRNHQNKYMETTSILITVELMNGRVP
jgi:hypothetical protein